MKSPPSIPLWKKALCKLGEGDGTPLDGGTLAPNEEPAYAQYLFDFIKLYAAQGIPIAAVTVQNEPFNPTNPATNTSIPTMELSVTQQDTVINDLHALLAGPPESGTEILGLDHNWNDVSNADTLLAGTKALGGIAFHCYRGDPYEQLQLPAGTPIFETECSPSGAYNAPPSDLSTSPKNFGGDLRWDTSHLAIAGVQTGSGGAGSATARTGSQTVMMWNMIGDQHYGPMINPGCKPPSACLPIEALGSDGIPVPNVGYYILGQLSWFVEPGSIAPGGFAGAQHIFSSEYPGDDLMSVAFRNPDGDLVLLVLNQGSGAATFKIAWDGWVLPTTISGDSVETYVWYPPGDGNAAKRPAFITTP
ncbi:MAG: glycoside hydrolase family 30 beta sandwich domain-containing protein [Solirubrobacteraceae bacterium]|jgi:glucosylceramidase